MPLPCSMLGRSTSRTATMLRRTRACHPICSMLGRSAFHPGGWPDQRLKRTELRRPPGWGEGCHHRPLHQLVSSPGRKRGAGTHRAGPALRGCPADQLVEGVVASHVSPVFRCSGRRSVQGRRRDSWAIDKSARRKRLRNCNSPSAGRSTWPLSRPEFGLSSRFEFRRLVELGTTVAMTAECCGQCDRRALR